MYSGWDDDFEYDTSYDDDDDYCFSDEDFGHPDELSVSDDWEDWPLAAGTSTEIDILFDELRLAAPTPEGNQVLLEEGLWDRLPEEIVCKILTWLPPAAQCRFRAVCSKWKTLLSSSSTSFQHYTRGQSRPSCTIMCGLGERTASFFCHSEYKWFDVPFKEVSSRQLDWELADVDGGLICYRCIVNGSLWLCVCNPITQSSQVLPPNYPHLSRQPPHVEILKLLVDRESKTFKVIVLVHSSDPPSTVVFDSTTCSWTIFGSVPVQDFREESWFAWKNVIYARSFQPGILLAFHMESGTWSEVETELPFSNESKYFIISSKDQVLLVKLNPMEDEPVCVWKLLDNVSENTSDTVLESASNVLESASDVLESASDNVPGNASDNDPEDVPVFSASKWEKVSIGSHTAMRTLAGEFRTCMSHGNDYICFTTDRTNQWVKYTFSTKTWCVMPCRGKRMAFYTWFDWEPGLDMDVDSGMFTETEHSTVESLQWGM